MGFSFLWWLLGSQSQIDGHSTAGIWVLCYPFFLALFLAPFLVFSLFLCFYFLNLLTFCDLHSLISLTNPFQNKIGVYVNTHEIYGETYQGKQINIVETICGQIGLSHGPALIADGGCVESCNNE